MDSQQPHGYMRPPPPPPPPLLPPMSMPADPYHHHQSQRLPVPPPNPWYSTQFQYQHSSPPPPPPPPHAHPPFQQWAPPPHHSDNFAPPPPPPYPAPSPYHAHHSLPPSQYPPPPPPTHQLPPLPPRPPIPAPQIQQSYPQVNQDWTNANWSHHQSWEYQANTNGEDWAAKARAWAAAKVVSDNQQGQQIYCINDGNIAGDSTAVFPARDSSINLLVHQQEVPSSYSSIAGDPVRGVEPVAAMLPDYTFNAPAEPAAIYPSVPAVLPSGPQVDLSAAVPSPVSGHSAAMFGRMPGPSFPATVSSVSIPFGISTVPELHPNTAFPGEAYGVLAVSDRPKKASVPNWLREEIRKKKPIIVSSAADVKEDTQSIEDESVDKSFEKGDQADSKSVGSARSAGDDDDDDDDDDEDEIEVTRTAAINQEIKRVLTEVLLKVTDELFDEIATKVLSEDDLAVEAGNSVTVSDHKASDLKPHVPPSKASAKALVSVRTGESNSYIASEKSTSSSPGDLLGLANYASEDDENNEIQSSEISKLMGNDMKQQTTSTKYSKAMDVVGSGNLLKEDKENLDKPELMESDPGSSSPHSKTVNHSAVVTESVKERSAREPTENDSSLSNKVDSRVAENLVDSFHASNSKEILGSKVVLKAAEMPVGNAIGKSDTEESRGHETQSKSDKDIHDDERKSTGKDHNIKECGYRRTYENHTRHDERNTKERKDENGSKDRTRERGVKPMEKMKDSDSRKRSSPDYVKKSRKEKERDRRASLKEDSGRKSERTKDEKREKHRQTNTSDSSRHKRRRSPSITTRGRDTKDISAVSRGSDLSGDSSDDSRKNRRLKRQKSPSPIRSKKRQVLRSPHSKHSQHRHSPYSSLEIARGRRSRSSSGSRSRSRSPIRRRR